MDEEKENLENQLNDAFEIFNKVSGNLVEAYENLEKKVSQLNIELEKKNEELSRTLTEVDSVKNHLNNILESMNMGVVVINIDGLITIFNRAAAELTGYERREVIRKNYKDFFYKSENEDKITPFDVLESKKIFRNVEKKLRLKTGEVIPIQSNIAPVVDKSGNIIGAVETFSDLREINRLKEEVERSKTLAALGEMSANVAHEIRNPLAGIGGYAALLERDIPRNDPRRELVKKIIEGVSSLNKIATNLLFYTRPMKPVLRVETINDILDEILYLVQMEIEHDKRDIKIETDYSETDFKANFDPEYMQQVFLNIFKNAVQSISQKGVITVKVRDSVSDGKINIEISDNGAGMEKEVMDKIFNPFFTTKSDGTGLGMAIVKKIIESHNGDITINSKHKKGSTFKISIPKH